MLNRSASLAMSTSVLKALPGKLDIKRHSPSILYLSAHTGSLVYQCNHLQNYKYWIYRDRTIATLLCEVVLAIVYVALFRVRGRFVT